MKPPNCSAGAVEGRWPSWIDGQTTLEAYHASQQSCIPTSWGIKLSKWAPTSHKLRLFSQDSYLEKKDEVCWPHEGFDKIWWIILVAVELFFHASPYQWNSWEHDVLRIPYGPEPRYVHSLCEACKIFIRRWSSASSAGEDEKNARTVKTSKYTNYISKCSICLGEISYADGGSCRLFHRESPETSSFFAWSSYGKGTIMPTALGELYKIWSSVEHPTSRCSWLWSFRWSRACWSL